MYKQCIICIVMYHNNTNLPEYNYIYVYKNQIYFKVGPENKNGILAIDDTMFFSSYKG